VWAREEGGRGTPSLQRSIRGGRKAAKAVFSDPDPDPDVAMLKKSMGAIQKAAEKEERGGKGKRKDSESLPPTFVFKP